MEPPSSSSHPSAEGQLKLPSIQTLTTASVKICENLPTEYNTVVLSPSQKLTQEPVMISGDVLMEYAVSDGVVSEAKVYHENVQELKTPPKLKDHKEQVVNGSSDEAKIHVRTSMQRKDSLDLSFKNENKKPPLPARFGHGKPVKASDGGKAALGVMKAKLQDTLESMWKMITEGRAMPVTRHLKESDTIDTHLRRNSPVTDQNGTPAVKKSEIFNGRSRTQSVCSKGREVSADLHLKTGVRGCVKDEKKKKKKKKKKKGLHLSEGHCHVSILRLPHHQL